jgi:DNA-binding NtrC family response regulator
VRELTNILERAFVLCHEEQIDLIHLPPEVVSAEGRIPKGRVEGHDMAQAPFSEGTAGEPTTASRPADDTPGVSRVASQEPWRLKPSEHKLLSSAENRADGAPHSSRRSSEQDRVRPEVQRLRAVLDAHGWQRGETAMALGISRSTLWRRMKEYGLL